MELTEKQKKFALEYIKTGNATQSAINSGYSKKTARVTGLQNLKKDYIRQFIDAELEKMQKEQVAEACEVMKYLTRVLRGEEMEEKLVKTVQQDGTTTTEIIQIKPSIKDRLKACELLGKRYGLFTDKIEIEQIRPIVITGADQLED